MGSCCAVIGLELRRILEKPFNLIRILSRLGLLNSSLSIISYYRNLLSSEFLLFRVFCSSDVVIGDLIDSS